MTWYRKTPPRKDEAVWFNPMRPHDPISITRPLELRRGEPEREYRERYEHYGSYDNSNPLDAFLGIVGLIILLITLYVVLTIVSFITSHWIEIVATIVLLLVVVAYVKIKNK